jgi:hypothetical protein
MARPSHKSFPLNRSLSTVAGENTPSAALDACVLVSVIVTPIACICPSRLSLSPPSSH